MMDSRSSGMDSERNSTDAQRNFGRYLRAERQLRQIPLREVAGATKIPVRTLELLEGGSWGDLPAEVFVRGFVRSYARHVGLPEGEAFGRYSDVVSLVRREEETRAIEAVGEAAAEVSTRRNFGVALFVIILLIIVTITFSLIWGTGANTSAQSSLDPSVDRPARAVSQVGDVRRV